MSVKEIKITPRAKDLGDNFKVRRALPSKEKRTVGPFVFWDHMGPALLEGDDTMTVRAHPHIGLSTLTYLFSGSILHRDSLGNELYIKPGEVNWMTAGRGITHSERSYPLDPPETLEGIQLWIGLPEEFEDIDPSFEHYSREELPKVEAPGIKTTLIAGEALGKKSPVKTLSSLFYLSVKIQKDKTYNFKVPQNEEAAIYIAKGSVKTADCEISKFDLLIFQEKEIIEFQALEDSEIMIFGGERFKQKRILYWNFVSHSQEKIDKAKSDWREGRFPKVINETEFIPLPG